MTSSPTTTIRDHSDEDKATIIAAGHAEQRRLASLVQIPPDSHRIDIATVCGLDISYEVGSDRCVAAAVVMAMPQSGQGYGAPDAGIEESTDKPTTDASRIDGPTREASRPTATPHSSQTAPTQASLKVLEIAVVHGTPSFPYVPGLLALREVPLLRAALAKLKIKPDLILCDGQGLAHPQRCGVACHLGVLEDVASVGCAKNHFVGEVVGDVGVERGCAVLLVMRDGEVEEHGEAHQSGALGAGGTELGEKGAEAGAREAQEQGPTPKTLEDNQPLKVQPQDKHLDSHQLPSHQHLDNTEHHTTTVGHVLRTQTAINPIFVSPGHLISHRQALEAVLAVSAYRVPEPIRLADQVSRRVLRETADGVRRE